MTVSQFFMPSTNLIGPGALDEGVDQIVRLGFKNALIVTDADLAKMGMAQTLVDKLKHQGIEAAVFDSAQPNPTVSNVNDGLEMLKQHSSDFVISLGGGSSHDCAKAIALVATNGGKIEDYEGLDQSAKPTLPLVSINTTAGTASEMTRFTIITDETRHVKMAIVDKHVTPMLSINDSELMEGMPASLTAATGMDALTHAVEAYVSTAATPLTDACAKQAIELIAEYLPQAVKEPTNKNAREKMAYAQFLAGMAFNNASLGYVHAMAHQLGGFYDLPHGVCNALLLPHVEEFNLKAAKDRLEHVGKLLGDNNSDLQGKDVISAIKILADIVGIPKSLEELGVKREDFGVLADNALKDVCGLTNPVQANKDEIIGIFEAAYTKR
ncbi:MULTISPECIES: iron-containing alcohol dehydrogenase [Moraxella]|uniref:Alcohol dehydrogenase n=1 Tax=Moraxella catarrhalis TaxID=480 RepID=A0A198UNU2_MORCA|nr:iron-containing alcohol dehydrogenase [Moraxella catarrhalis]OAU95922.1 Alcohol dehydrogenase [Moraxella catarrhalis]OAU97995.1 Alcohol dehydrogenase [Moraxella catarrhalis]OAU98916.1 Alcohol dehydrogenase [Moraxella catarrhalis]OAV00380.1 Alcohol dehydrogenase [Moraxella catarrhalis]STY82629.1 Alcohol dehydrogenase 2 [Moraxella catarrhalis]